MPHLRFLSKHHEQRHDTPSHSLYMIAIDVTRGYLHGFVCREEEEPEAMEDTPVEDADEKDSKPPVGEARSPGGGRRNFPNIVDRESNISMEDSQASPGDMFARSFMTVEGYSPP